MEKSIQNRDWGFYGKKAFLGGFEWEERIFHIDGKMKFFSAPPGLSIFEGCLVIEWRPGLGSEVGNGLLNEGTDWTAGASLSVPALVF